MLFVDNESKMIGDFSMQEISLHLPIGYIMGLVGQNGSGKTSLFHLIMGLYTTETGRIEINGSNIKENEGKSKNDIGYVLAEELFEMQLTLKDNADMFGKYYSSYDESVFLDYCRKFSLLPNKKLRKYSRGEKLKFQFAFALSHNPKLLIFDEPTASFDPEFRVEFLEIITHFVSDGEHSVLLATHLTGELDRIADYIMFLAWIEK